MYNTSLKIQFILDDLIFSRYLLKIFNNRYKNMKRNTPAVLPGGFHFEQPRRVVFRMQVRPL